MEAWVESVESVVREVAVSGSIIRPTVAERLMVIVELRTGLADPRAAQSRIGRLLRVISSAVKEVWQARAAQGRAVNSLAAATHRAFRIVHRAPAIEEGVVSEAVLA